MNLLKIKILMLVLKEYPSLCERIIKNPNRYNVNYSFDIRTYEIRVKFRFLKGIIVDKNIQVRDLKQIMKVNLDQLTQL